MMRRGWLPSLVSLLLCPSGAKNPIEAHQAAESSSQLTPDADLPRKAIGGVLNLEPLARTHAVLVVDDDELLTRVVCNALQKAGYAVTVAQDGANAVKMAVEQRPAIILVDLRMPGIDGHTIMRRAHAQGVDAAFVVMSGSRDPEDIIDAIRNGASDYISKPFSLSELMTAMGRATESYEKGRGTSAGGPAHGSALPDAAAARGLLLIC